MSTGSRQRWCVDCRKKLLLSPTQGRSPRCAEHHAAYRAWYQRKWKHERRYGRGTYPEKYEPNPVPQLVYKVDAAVPLRLAEVQRLLDRASTAFFNEVQRAGIRQRPQLHRDVLVPLNTAAQELAEIVENLKATRTFEPTQLGRGPTGSGRRDRSDRDRQG